MLKYMEVFMSLTNHYPFATIPLNYNLTSFEDFLDFQTLSIHYNQIYKEFVDDLNFILSTEISLQKLTLDEILFNEKILQNFIFCIYILVLHFYWKCKCKYFKFGKNGCLY